MFDSTKRILSEILDDICKGKIQLPDFQRGWVWDDEHIRSLLISIARSFPVGSIMLLEAGGQARFKIRPIEGLNAAILPANAAEELILDGQQRLTSLTQVMRLDQPVLTRDVKGRQMRRYYYINIEKALEGPDSYEDAFFGVDESRQIKTDFGRKVELDLSTAEKEFENFCFPCNQILNSDKWEEGLNAFDSAKFSRYMQFRKQILSQFRQYPIPVIILKREVPKEAVCLVFEKVNTAGVALSVFELLTATYAADGINLRDEWFGNVGENVTGIVQKLKTQNLLQHIEPTEFFQSLSLLHTLQRRTADIANGKIGKQATGVSAKREAILGMPLSAYQEWKDKLVLGYLKAAKFLRKEAFYSNKDIPYRTQLIPLAAALVLIDEKWLEPKVYQKLAQWFWCGVFGELYGGAVETRMALDLQDLIEWEKNDSHQPITVRDANFQPRRLETMKSRLSAAYKGIHVLLQRQGAKDFFWKTTLREMEQSDWDEISVDIHHIFPKVWCDAKKIAPAIYNSIINKTPISYKANRMINHKSTPSEYLDYLQNHKNVKLSDQEMDAILQSHLIDPALLRANNFEDFMKARKSALLKQIEVVMGKLSVESGEAIPNEQDEEELVVQHSVHAMSKSQWKCQFTA